MKSIRRSLLSNLLILMVLTLAVVLGIVYKTTAESIGDKRVSDRELIELQFREKTDDALLSQAHLIARETQSRFNVDRLKHQTISTFVQFLLTPVGQYSQFPLTVQLSESIGNPMSWWLHARLATEIKLNEDDIYHENQNPSQEYVQLNSDWGATWQSKSLNGQFLPSDQSVIPLEGLYQSRFDSLNLPNQHSVRRVIVRVPVTRFSRIGSFSPPSPPQRPRYDEPRPPRYDDSRPFKAISGVASHARQSNSRPNMFNPPPAQTPLPPPPDLRNAKLPTILINVAWDLTNPHPTVGIHQLIRDQQLEEIDKTAQATLRTLRTKLAWIAGLALFVALTGGWLLVGMGLAPLKRLSNAVSEISEKEFRVPIEPASLPNEVAPIVDRLSLALTELQKAFAREKRAAADISHELRTPLAAMSMTLEVAARKTRSVSEYQETIQDCRAIAKQLNQLVERMLALAWLDTGSDVIRPEPVEVSELVDGCVTIGKPLAEVHGVKFHVQKPDHFIMNTDPSKVREVLMNLVHNAIEYNQPGGRIDVSATPMPDGGIVLEVTDTGIGMTPEVQEKIFERFFRADPSRHATGAHAGLGLAIVKEYVDRLGGKMKVESTVGKGSKFRVELPNAS